MIIRIEDIKDICKKISKAVDNTSSEQISGLLQIKSIGEYLYLIVSNKKYYVKAKLNLHESGKFNATVDARLFLNLISNCTADTVELNSSAESLNIVCNGTYKLPLVCDSDDSLEIPEIKIGNITQSFMVDKETLLSISQYNSKEISWGIPLSLSNVVQQLYYLDEEGCITFTTGACVNKFHLEKPIKLLLDNGLVNLFKLFNDDKIKLEVGFDQLSEDTIATKLSLSDSYITIVSVLPSNDTLVNSVPVKAIRDRAFSAYDYSVTLNRVWLLDSIKRLLLFYSKSNDSSKCYLTFSNNNVTIYDENKVNYESLYYEGDDINCDYSCSLNILYLRAALENCSDQYVTVLFGNHQAFVFVRNNIYNILPELNA